MIDWKSLILVGAFALLASCASPPEPTYLGRPDEGWKVARDNCQSCHAIGRTDASANVMAPPLRDILAYYPADMLAKDLRDSKSFSYLHMPLFFFGEHHPDDLVAYLKTLQPPTGPKVGEAQSEE